MTLSDFLSKNKEQAKKLFTEKELQIIHKQLQGERLTQPEKNVLSRSVRKKLKVIEDLAEFKDEFRLKKNQDNLRLIERAVEVILEDRLKDKIKAILLFGSTLGTMTKRSDVDICVLFSKITLKEATEFRIRVSGELSARLDIQVFNTLPEKIKKEIAKNHIILYKNNFDNVSFITNTIKDQDHFIRRKNILET
ncbi:MAG: nucleotidyltransferase family protein [Candidatus Muiribacteriota bacterium]